MIRLFTDGGSRGNPGPSGAGFVFFENGVEIFSGRKFLGKQTNNYAEYMALILGLEQAQKDGRKDVACFLDSELVVKQLNGVYRVKHFNLKTLFFRVQELRETFENISFAHVRREKNKRADQLVNEAIDEHK